MAEVIQQEQGVRGEGQRNCMALNSNHGKLFSLQCNFFFISCC